MMTRRGSPPFYRVISPWLILIPLVLIGECEGVSGGRLKVSLPVWKDSAGEPLPFQDVEAIEEFLLTAQVLASKSVGTGVTGVRKLLLEKGKTKAYACFRDVNVFKHTAKFPGEAPKIDFRDNAIFEVAAYELAKLLGIPTFPPTVKRQYRGKKGSVQLWVDGCMMERQRAKKKIPPPNPWNWAMQLQVIRLFDVLIYNEDRTQENILIDSEWRLWMIDHTRAFRRFRFLKKPESIRFCEQTLLERLSTLSDESIRQTLIPYLTESEIASLLARRTLLLDHISAQIDEKGAKNVLYRLWKSSGPAPLHQLTQASILK
ncbi:MAG: hypothetical protein JSU96_18205 [Acidobacteriota bacterium]|nr:MAG: hypothetical protein JSU96_18205 [Acidobacteriota bacterium]